MNIQQFFTGATLTVAMFAFQFPAHAQSAMFARSDYGNGKGFYSVVYNAPIEHALVLAKQKLLDKGCPDDTQLFKQAESAQKGYGVVIKGIEKSGAVDVEIFGAAFGCKSYMEAEKQAVENMKRFHIDWTESKYEVLLRVADL